MTVIAHACIYANGKHGPCSCDHAVVWDAQGRGACGAHHQRLVRGEEP